MRFADVWELHNDMLHRRCVTWMHGHRDDADEAYSRTAMQALQGWPGDDFFNDGNHAKAWLLTVARNVCWDLYRERKKRREVSLESEVDETRGGRITILFATFPHPEQQYVEREQRRILRVSMNHLPPLLRDTAMLHFLRDMPYRDVARHLGITEANVRKRIQQAREQLRIAVRTPVRGVAPPVKTRPREESVLHRVRIGDRDVWLELPLPHRDDPRRLERLQANFERHPRGGRKRLELARVLASRGRLEEAIPHYRAIVAKQCFPPHPWLELGAILEALGRVAEAIAIYETGSVEVGRCDDRLHLHALALFTRGALDDAQSTISQAIACDPDCARHHRLQGRIAFARADAAVAIASLERCLAIEPRDAIATLLLDDIRQSIKI